MERDGSMPRIGLRIIKTAVAVFLCLLLDLWLLWVAPALAPRLYSPFFAGLAACYSISNDRTFSFKLAKVRSIGSIFGSIVAVSLVLLFELVLMPMFLPTRQLLGLGIKYAIVSLGLVLLIYLTILTRQTDATFVACLTYLSIAVGNRTDLDPTTFALNRTLSTIVGVLIALLANFLAFHWKRNRQILFAVGVDHILSEQVEPVSIKTKFKLNELLYNGCHVTISTIRTPASLLKTFAGVHFQIPQIVMNGAALYDVEKNSFSGIIHIEGDTRRRLEDIFNLYHTNYFSHIILNDVLTIYYGELTNQGEKLFFENRKNSPFKSYAKGEAPIDEPVVFYIVVAPKETILAIVDTIHQQGLDQQVDMVAYPFSELEGYYNLKIRNGKATRMQALDRIQESVQTSYLVAIGNNDFDIPMLKKADCAVCLSDASDKVKEVCDIIICKEKPNAAVRFIAKVFYHQLGIRYLEKQKKWKRICKEKKHGK